MQQYPKEQNQGRPVKKEEGDLFSTRDLYLAATLITLRFPLVTTDFQLEGMKPKPVGYFVFDNTPALRDAREKYMQSLLMVEPKLFITNMHSLKSYVHNVFSNPRDMLFK